MKKSEIQNMFFGDIALIVKAILIQPFAAAVERQKEVFHSVFAIIFR